MSFLFKLERAFLKNMMNNYGIKRNTIRIDFLIKLAKINFNKVKKNR